MGGVALEKYRRAFESNRNASSATVDKTQSVTTKSRNKPLPPPIKTDLSPNRPPPVPTKEVQHAASFTVPVESQNGAGATGKRPAGTRLTSEPPALAGTQTATDIQKSKERISLWKKPVSGLLMRRKASQNAPDIRPLPLPQKSSESTFDPRIRGTRVHDFSAPRQRVVPTRKPTVPGAEVWTGWESRDGYPQAQAQAPAPAPAPAPVQSITADLPLRTQTGKSGSSSSTKTARTSPEVAVQQSPELVKEPSQKSTRQIDRLSLENKPLPEQPPPPPPSNKDDASTRSLSNKSRPISAASSIKRTNPSTRTNRSRHISLSDGSIRDSLPKHMKSTSSRFSFDMIGAARAEKLLEERHRQKELERKANDPGSTRRDSRFDEFDEDNFDYDAAMDDDGLEERIPGVNADFDDDDAFFEEAPFEEDIPMLGEVDVIEEEDDPDNDQENFAGFVFARSNPQSSLVSPATPGMAVTPRDANGRPIGHAITKDETPGIHSAMSPLPTESDDSEEQGEQDDGFTGLGIHGLQAPPKSAYDPTVFQERRNVVSDDPLSGSTAGHDNELYFDRGLQEELQMAADEIQESTIDESIFDIDDTDQFGRPIPGAFAQAMKAVKEQEQKKRESDMTSQSGMSASTAHTSVSVLQSSTLPTGKLDDLDSSAKESPPATSPSQSTEDKVAAYLQQALAKAAASDLNSRWDDAPEPSLAPGDPNVTITSPTTGSQPSSAGVIDDPSSHIYDDDDGFGRGFDDGYDDDDDYGADFIAEANAEALAYDSEGFYSQEFGFYSAPVPQPHHSSNPSTGSNGSLGSDTFYGGYFGPSGGLIRSASGHVTREPNLTPITERSEYSNRNSIMSLGLPSAALPSAGLDSRNAMQSPALSTLMGLDDGDFSLSGLYRLRNKTFGGSQISLSSSKEGSPRSERAPTFEERHPPPWEVGRPQSHLGLAPSGGPIHHARKNSNYSLWSNSDAAASNPNSPSMANVSLPGYSIPPQPLTSPPPIPQPSPGPVPQCLPVIEDDDEESLTKASSSAVGGDVSPARTIKGISVFAAAAGGGGTTPSTARSRASSSGDVLTEIARNHIAFMANSVDAVGVSASQHEVSDAPSKQQDALAVLMNTPPQLSSHSDTPAAATASANHST